MTEVTVIAPEGCMPFFTPGKKYAAIKFGHSGFKVINDLYCTTYCSFKECAYLNGQDWKVSIPAVMEKVK